MNSMYKIYDMQMGVEKLKHHGPFPTFQLENGPNL